MAEHACPPQPPCGQCQQVVYPPTWAQRFGAVMWSGRWYGMGGLVPIFEYRRDNYHAEISRTAGITWWRQRLELSWTHDAGRHRE